MPRYLLLMTDSDGGPASAVEIDATDAAALFCEAERHEHLEIAELYRDSELLCCLRAIHVGEERMWQVGRGHVAGDRAFARHSRIAKEEGSAKPPSSGGQTGTSQLPLEPKPPKDRMRKPRPLMRGTPIASTGSDFAAPHNKRLT